MLSMMCPFKFDKIFQIQIKLPSKTSKLLFFYVYVPSFVHSNYSLNQISRWDNSGVMCKQNLSTFNDFWNILSILVLT